MGSVDRLSRVNELLKREIADFIEKFGVSVPGCIVSITSVQTAVTLRHAKVMVSVLGGGEEEKLQVVKYLEKEKNEIQKSVARNVVLKYTPVLHFSIDRNIEEGDRVLALMEKLERDNKI